MVTYSRPLYEPDNEYWYMHMFTGDKDVAEMVWEQHGATWHIANLQVMRPYQRQGYGKILVRHLEEMAKNKGAKMISIYALRAAVPFWTKLGYSMTGEQPDTVSFGMNRRIG